MTRRYAPSPDVVAREVGGEQVLLDMRTGQYFGLNAVGTAVWQELEREPADADRLTGAVLEAFDAEPATVEADLRALLDELSARGLVVER